MQGFDPEFTGIEHYITAITERIWEGRGIDLVRRFYTPGCIVRTPGGVTTSVEDVVRSTLETLQMFPDRQLLPEDIVWSGDPAAGFYSSHRILSPMHHRGAGLYGPATGRAVQVRTIADCAVRDNQVYEEWLVRDQAAIVRQLGLDPERFAAEAVAYEEPHPAMAPAGLYAPVVARDREAAFYAETLERLWNDTALGEVAHRYASAASLASPGGEQGVGRAVVEGVLIGYLASFPDARLRIDHLIARQDPGRPVRVAARWEVQGTHSGRGRFGTPGGTPVRFMGISHAHVVDGRIVAEWMLVDEVALWMQIARGGG